MMDDAQLARYSRHILLPEIDEEGQEKLTQARLACVGLGGLANAALPLLAGAGIGNINLIDADRIDSSNLPRQTLYEESMIDSPKALAAQEALMARNPHVKLHAINENLTDNNAERLLQGADIILDATDNFPARYRINDWAMKLEIPFISASLMRFGGQMSFFAPHRKDDEGIMPCYRCLYPEPPPDDLLPRCDQLGVFAPAASLFGVLMASEALKYLLGIGTPLIRKLLICELDDMQFQQIRYLHNPHCKA